MDEGSVQKTVDETQSIDGGEEVRANGFEKPWLVEIDNVPEATRIVGRDDMIKFLSRFSRSERRSGATRHQKGRRTMIGRPTGR
jgi:hypothetical protein